MNRKGLFFAEALSWGLSPFLVAPLSTLVAVFAYATTGREVLEWGLISFALIYFPPAVAFMMGYQLKRIAHFRMLERTERTLPYLAGIIGSIIAIILLFLVGAAPPLIVMSAILTVTVIVLAIVNVYTKVSLHAATLTGASTTLGLGVHPIFYLLLLFIPAIAWARLYKRRHTLLQVLLGVLIATVIPVGIWFGGQILLENFPPLVRFLEL